MTTQTRMRAGEQTLRIPCGDVSLTGDLVVPTDAVGVVVFAHGSGSSRLSPRNRYVAGVLQAGGLATLLFDLLTTDEERIDERTRALRFDIPLLAQRLVGTTDWLADFDVADLPLGYFGASTGAAAALIAAARRPERVRAVVSRGGRPDLAMPVLAEVRAPTLLVVGGLDRAVIEMNREALAALRAPKKLEIVAGATHLFEEPGTLEEVAALARDWLLLHLRAAPSQPSGRGGLPVG
ncbi:MAG TPA: dienelactone hydrolase family protein [Longimicrobiales bacterium]|nr:dienelactone hydrolase family protein [Longimicrobiales bacterium]